MPKPPASVRPFDERLREYVHYSELKQLAYSIAAMQQEKMFHALAVLSFYPEEGKTLFCASLAQAYSETCQSKVLIVDTANFQNKNSLTLKNCFNGATPLVEVATLNDLKKIPNAGVTEPPPQIQNDPGPVLDVEVVTGKALNVTTFAENDFSLIKKVAEDHSKKYGLVLIDTAPIKARNRNNVDPLLVARLAGASVLVASRKLLDSPELGATLKTLKDPSLHLLGIVSNEVFDR